MPNDYRHETKRVEREARWTFFKFLPFLLIVIAVFAAIGWGVKASGIIGKNIEREVVQQSQQYTESKQAKLQNLYTEYVSLQTDAAKARAAGQEQVAQSIEAQQKAILAQMRRETTNISKSEVPEEVSRLLEVSTR